MTPFTCRHIEDLFIAGDVDALRQSADAQHHLEHCADCRELLDGIGDTDALLALAPPVAMPAATADAILAQVDMQQMRREKKRRRFAWLNELFGGGAGANPWRPTLWRQFDLRYFNFWFASFCAHVAAVVVLLVYPYELENLREDLFNEPNRFAALILEAPQQESKQKYRLDRIKKKREKSAAETSAGLKDKEDVLGRKTEAKKKDEIKQKFTRLFSGSGNAGSLLGSGGGGTISGSLSNLIGTVGKGSTGGGIAGLGIRGSGPMTGGGVGTSLGIGGIGTSGRLGGGGIGYGSGVGLGKRKDRGMITLSTPVVMGALPPDVIKRVINENKAQVRYCYERALQKDPALAGRIVIRWIISATGSVAAARVKESSLADESVGKCITTRVKRWKFPAPSGGGIVEVSYPFVFRSE